MNIAKYSLDNPKVIYFFLAIMLIGGIFSFESLGKKEDSPFVIKTAVLITKYPGASPQEVGILLWHVENQYRTEPGDTARRNAADVG